MTDAPVTLLLPGLLTFILYAVALLAVIGSRRSLGPPKVPRPPRRPRLRVLPGGAARASGRA